MCVLILAVLISQAPKAENSETFFLDLGKYPPGITITILNKGRPAPVCTDIFAYEAYIKATRARDAKGVEDLAKAGKIFMVESKTKAKCLEQKDNPFIAKGHKALEVRILSGPHKEKTGWVPEPFYGVESRIPEIGEEFPLRLPTKIAETRAMYDEWIKLGEDDQLRAIAQNRIAILDGVSVKLVALDIEHDRVQVLLPNRKRGVMALSDLVLNSGEPTKPKTRSKK